MVQGLLWSKGFKRSATGRGRRWAEEDWAPGEDRVGDAWHERGALDPEPSPTQPPASFPGETNPRLSATATASTRF